MLWLYFEKKILQLLHFYFPCIDRVSQVCKVHHSTYLIKRHWIDLSSKSIICNINTRPLKKKKYKYVLEYLFSYMSNIRIHSEVILRTLFFFHSCNGAYLYRKISTLNVRIISFVNIWIFFFCLQSKIDSTNIILDYIIKGLRHDLNSRS